jgi:hypothetical protein
MVNGSKRQYGGRQYLGWLSSQQSRLTKLPRRRKYIEGLGGTKNGKPAVVHGDIRSGQPMMNVNTCARNRMIVRRFDLGLTLPHSSEGEEMNVTSNSRFRSEARRRDILDVMATTTTTDYGV